MPHTARVVIVQSSIRRYRAAFFAELRERLDDAGVRLELVHSTEGPDEDPRGDAIDIPWALRVPADRIPVGRRAFVWQRCLRRAAGADLVVVEQASQMLLNYVLLGGQGVGGAPLAFWGHGRNHDPDASAAGETVKRWVSRRAHWWFAYTDGAADVVAALGFPRDRVTVVRNAGDSRGLAAQVAAVPDPEVAALRDRLGLPGARVGLYLGALHESKRLGFLLAAADRVRAEVPGFALLVVGDGEQRPELEAAAAQRPWLRLLGHRAGADLAGLLRLAEVLCVPGWVGLVVVDSFAAGVPLIASASGPHPPEIEYLVDGVNGLLVDDGGDPDRYADAVAGLLRDDARRAALAAGAARAGTAYSAQDMAERFAAGVLAALAARREPRAPARTAGLAGRGA